MQDALESDREWDPDEGDELTGTVIYSGPHESTDEESLLIQPEDSTEFVLVPYWADGLAKKFDEVDPERGDRVRIKYLGEVEAMRSKFEEEEQRFPEYEVELIGEEA